jgi:hypothetical protein
MLESLPCAYRIPRLWTSCGTNVDRTEGEGQELRAFCSCPAGRKGGAFCKHVAYLLQGEVSKLASPSTEDVNEFVRRAQGSPLLAKAGVRIDKDMRQAEAAGLYSLSGVFAKYKAELEDLGWTVSFIKNDGERDEDRLELYATFKNGNLRRTPSIVFEFVRNDYDYSEDYADLSAWGEELDGPATLRPRERPYRQRGDRQGVGSHDGAQPCCRVP